MLCERGGASIHAVFEQTVLKFFLPRDPSTSSLSFYTPTEEVYTQSWQAKRGLGFSGVSLEERKGYISLGVLLTGSWDPDRRRDSGKAINDMAFFARKRTLGKGEKLPETITTTIIITRSIRDTSPICNCTFAVPMKLSCFGWTSSLVPPGFGESLSARWFLFFAL